jgi:glycosyltransferase involved in cell wall biosynthesis
VADGVEMPGQRDDVHEWLARGRAFLLTSPDEGLSIALLEAMCAGAVPVVPDVGELGDVVRTGETGFLVTSRRPADYVERLLELLADDARRASLSERAREVACAHAGLEAVSARWDALFDRLSAPEPLS